MEAVRVEFDPEVRAWYLTLSDASVSGTVHISEEVAVDVNPQGAAVGAEFLLAPAELDAEVREALFQRFPAIRAALAALSDLQALAVA